MPISIRPDIELPDTVSFQIPTDALNLIEEMHQGLHKIEVSKEVRRGSTKDIATIICQETNDPTIRPDASPEELGEFVMSIIQYEIDESDDPGRYLMSLVGPRGRGGFRKSKHIDIHEGDALARTMSLLSEGDLIEQQRGYIGELQSQIIGMVELLIGAHKTVVQENKEMLKIVSEASRKHAEIERDRMRHQLELKMHDDDVKMQIEEMERRHQKFREGLKTFTDTEAAEQLVRALARRLDPNITFDNSKKESKEEPKPGKKIGIKNFKQNEPPQQPPSPEQDDSKTFVQTVNNDEVISEDEALKRMETEPVVMAIEALRMSIRVNNQWGVIRDTLNEKQIEVLDDIFASSTDEEAVENLQRLADTKGILRLKSLRDQLDEAQTKILDFLLGYVKM